MPFPCPGMPASIQPGDPEQVRDLFDRIAPAYDSLNDLLSLGLHRIWKRQAVAWLEPQAGQCVLDLCCGTGDLALVVAEKVRPAGLVLGIDAAAAPLERARERARSQPWLPVEFRQGDAAATGLADASADAAVMAYGLRNLPDPAAGLQELRRLLIPGGIIRLSTPDLRKYIQGYLDPDQHFVVLGEEGVLTDVCEIQPDEVLFVAIDTILCHSYTSPKSCIDHRTGRIWAGYLDACRVPQPDQEHFANIWQSMRNG